MKKSTSQRKQGRVSSENYAKYFSTLDPGCSTATINGGFDIFSMNKTDPKKARSIFQRKAGIVRIMDAYWTDKLNIKARTFFNNTKMLKNRIFNE